MRRRKSGALPQGLGLSAHFLTDSHVQPCSALFNLQAQRADCAPTDTCLPAKLKLEPKAFTEQPQGRLLWKAAG